MWADHLDIPSGRMSDSVRRIIDAAASTAHRDGHTELTSGHLFLACMQLEWNVVAGVLRDGDVNPNEIVLAIEDAVSDLPSVQGAELRVPQATRLVVKLALQRASRAGRELMDPADLLAALLEEHRGLRPPSCASTGSTRRRCSRG